MFSSRKRSNLISVLIHSTAVLLILIAGRIRPIPNQPIPVPPPHVKLLPPYIPRTTNTHRVGGGGGDRDPLPASKGQVARTSPRVFTPPMAVIRNIAPQLSIEPTLAGPPQIMAVMPDIPYGVPNGSDGPLSNGPGTNGGIGRGNRGGQGDHDGPGSGPDDGGGVSDPRGHILGSTVAPILLTKVDPEYSDDARKAKVQGIVVIHLDVDTSGRPQNIKVVHGLGLGLDDRAVEAVRKWRFKAGLIDGKPAVTSAVVEVSFRLL